MPVLRNPKHERFAQERAKGVTADDAYVTAGYSENRSNAARLSANELVTARVAELQHRVAEITNVTLAGITEDLARIAKKAEALDDTAGLSVARLARMDIAKLHGLSVERKQHGLDLSKLPDHIVDAVIAAWNAGSPDSRVAGGGRETKALN